MKGYNKILKHLVEKKKRKKKKQKTRPFNYQNRESYF